MSDCIAIANGRLQGALEFDSFADQIGDPMLTGQFVAPGVAWASQLPPLLTATFTNFGSVTALSLNAARAAANALVCLNQGPSAVCIAISVNPLTPPAAGIDFGVKVGAGESVLLSKPAVIPSTPVTTFPATVLYVAGFAPGGEAVLSFRFGNASITYRCSVVGAF